MAACSDTADAPTTPLQQAPSTPNRLVAYNSNYPTTAEWDAMGGYSPIVTANVPTGTWSADGKTWTVTGTFSMKYVNEARATLTATISDRNNLQVLGQSAAPYKYSVSQPSLTAITPTLRTQVSSTKSCDIVGRAQIDVEGSLKLLNDSQLPVTVYTMPSSATAGDVSRPICNQSKSDSAYVEPMCEGQTILAPGGCTTGTSSGGTLTGGGSGCQLWVRRVYVSYDGGRSWSLQSETYFQRC